MSFALVLLYSLLIKGKTSIPHSLLIFFRNVKLSCSSSKDINIQLLPSLLNKSSPHRLTSFIKLASSDKVRERAKTDKGYQQRVLIKHLRDKGLISDEILNDKKYGKLFRYKNEKGEVV